MAAEDLRRRHSPVTDIALRERSSYEAGLETLRAAILDGTLPAGSRLPQQDLAKVLGTGRIPVRRSLRVLEFEGLVRSEPNRGYTVTALEADEIEDIYQLRILLEGHAVRLAVPLLGGPDFDALEAIHEAMVREADPAQVLLLRDAFRARLYAVTNRPRLTGAIVHLRQAVARAMVGRHAHHRPDDLARFFEAIKAGDADAAVADLAGHYRRTSGLLRRYIREDKARRRSTPNQPKAHAPGRPGSVRQRAYRGVALTAGDRPTATRGVETGVVGDQAVGVGRRKRMAMATQAAWSTSAPMKGQVKPSRSIRKPQMAPPRPDASE